MTTSGYCPARFGMPLSLIPCAPWHMLHCWIAIVAPRPLASADPERAMACVSTTLVVRRPAFDELVGARHSLATPAALQMPSQTPLAVKSPCTDGSQTKP